MELLFHFLISPGFLPVVGFRLIADEVKIRVEATTCVYKEGIRKERRRRGIRRRW